MVAKYMVFVAIMLCLGYALTLYVFKDDMRFSDYATYVLMFVTLGVLLDIREKVKKIGGDD